MEEGKVWGAFHGTPCTTFSAARNGPPGPRPLRDLKHPYGLPKTSLTIQEQQEVRLGSYFALKSAAFCKLMYEHNLPFGLENPRPRKGIVSMFDLSEFVSLAALRGVSTVDFDQCPYGAETAKPTRVIFSEVDLTVLFAQCNHEPREWTWKDWHGRTVTARRPHPPLAGRLRDSGEPATKAAAAYPSDLNLRLAEAFAPLIP